MQASKLRHVRIGIWENGEYWLAFSERGESPFHVVPRVDAESVSDIVTGVFRGAIDIPVYAGRVTKEGLPWGKRDMPVRDYYAPATRGWTQVEPAIKALRAINDSHNHRAMVYLHIPTGRMVCALCHNVPPFRDHYIWLTPEEVSRLEQAVAA